MTVKPRGCCDTYHGTSASLSDRVEKDFSSRPDVCDYHVRSHVMESLAATEEH